MRSEIVATCSADLDAVRIPTQDYVARVCLTDQHRRCEVFRRYLGIRLAKPDDVRAMPAQPIAKTGR
jgi:hypothetical protein